MIELQSPIENVIAFRARSQAMWTLSTRDRLDLSQWHDRIIASGYHTVLYERECGDSPEISAFVSIYRNGQPWALWSMARRATGLCVWCSKTSQDVGTFASVAEVLEALLPACIAERVDADATSTGTLVPLYRVS